MNDDDRRSPAAPPGNGHRRARYEDALDAQIRLLDLARHRLLPMMTSDGDAELPTHVNDVLVARLMRAEPVFVAPDVLEAWEFARAAFEPEPLQADEPFTPTGLVLFPRPIGMGRHGPPDTDALLWSVAPPELRVVQLQQRQGDWRVLGVFLTPLNTTLRATLDELAAQMDGWGSFEEHKTTQTWASIQSFWRMARGFVRVPERASRPGRRAAKRALLEREHVTVIRLRRQRRDDPDDPETERDVDWQCRWMVRGHWRHLQDGRQTWVMAHVKGPDDKPFRVNDRVWEFVR